MAKSLTLGNGKFLINLGQFGEVADLYYPYAGLENHIGGHLLHQVGVFVDNRLTWLSDKDWDIKIESGDNVLASRIQAVNRRMAVALYFTDLVYNEKDIFVRKVAVKNLSVNGGLRVIKIFFHQQFELYESHVAHTGYFDPIHHAIIHYRSQRVFLLNATFEGKPFDDYSVGVFGAEGKEGTHRDAEDGVLAKNNIEHGQVDSVLGLTTELAPLAEKLLYYWLIAGESVSETLELNDYVLKQGPGHLVETTENFWRAWVGRRQFSFHGLSDKVVKLFNQSLLLLRVHVNNNGGIIASGDSGTQQSGKDTYAYVWPRDAAMAALALSSAGDANVAKLFFNFCNQVLSPDGYFMHKYSPDGSLGSSWHPWLRDGKIELPIQEDGTALIVFTLWRYYEITKDLEFVELVYNSLIKRASDFMVLYRDEHTGLPKASYDLWEEKWGVSTFTAASVYGALCAAANFARLLGKVKSETLYSSTAEKMKAGILKYLFDERRGYFYKMVKTQTEEIVYDLTVDVSSIYGIVNFGVLPAADERVRRAISVTERTLKNSNSIGGLARYEHDAYLRGSSTGPGNPWFISTLWLAQYYVKVARDEKDLEKVKEYLNWCTRYAQPSGILSEQLDPRTGAQLSVAPLVWSQAEFVQTVINYLDKLEALGICQACNTAY